MKKICINYENSFTNLIFDDDDSNLEEYTNELSKVLEVSKVTILETSEGNLILRPHKIMSISVTEEELPKIKSVEEEDVIRDA